MFVGKDKLGFVFLILIVGKGEFVINLVEYKGKFAKLSYLIIITIVWLTGVGSNIVGPLQTILNKGIMPYVDIINLLSANRTIIP